MHDLPAPVRRPYLHEMSLVAQAVYHAFRPRKLNYELLGNAEPHLHWHLFPRHADDPSPGTTSWKVAKSLRYAESARPTTAELLSLKQKLLSALTEIDGLRILATWQSGVV